MELAETKAVRGTMVGTETAAETGLVRRVAESVTEKAIEEETAVKKAAAVTRNEIVVEEGVVSETWSVTQRGPGVTPASLAEEALDEKAADVVETTVGGEAVTTIEREAERETESGG